MQAQPIGSRYHCDFCKQPAESTIIDGRTRLGFWAWMCEACHRVLGVGLGTGCGQKFEVQGDGSLVKVDG